MVHGAWGGDGELVFKGDGASVWGQEDCWRGLGMTVALIMFTMRVCVRDARMYVCV